MVRHLLPLLSPKSLRTSLLLLASARALDHLGRRRLARVLRRLPPRHLDRTPHNNQLLPSAHRPPPADSDSHHKSNLPNPHHSNPPTTTPSGLLLNNLQLHLLSGLLHSNHPFHPPSDSPLWLKAYQYKMPMLDQMHL